MNLENIEQSATGISKSIIRLLTNYIPTTRVGDHLEDIVLLLMYELLQGNLNFNIDTYISPLKLKGKGWPKTHLKVLINSGWLDGGSAPINLTGNQLSWSRWHYEMTNTVETLLTKKKLLNIEERLSSRNPMHDSTKHLDKKQLLAVDAITKESLILLSGGPGTGKTNTIVQMLIRALNISPNLNIGLAAPTGKAARRMQEALSKNVEDISKDQMLKISNIPTRTIHSWLKATPLGFTKNKSSPLNLDLLVVDEMSMVDLALMQALLEALPQDAKLILVGDSNQLPPVGSGAIWQELQKAHIRSQFGKSAIHLDKLYRNRGDIAYLSKVIQDKGLDSFWEKVSCIEQPSNVALNISRFDHIPRNVLDQLEQQKLKLKTLANQLGKELAKSKKTTAVKQLNPNKLTNEIFTCLENLMVLCPRRNGIWGVNHVHQTLLKEKLEGGVMNWSEGTPIICSENQQDLGLSNGDIGIIIGNSENRKLLFKIFTDAQTLTTCLISPARVKNLAPAFALTIHKSQGSESQKVILLWPSSFDNSSNKTQLSATQKSFSQRLLYTAITRAKEELELNIRNP